MSPSAMGDVRKVKMAGRVPGPSATNTWSHSSHSGGVHGARESGPGGALTIRAPSLAIRVIAAAARNWLASTVTMGTQGLDVGVEGGDSCLEFGQFTLHSGDDCFRSLGSEARV